MAAIPGSVRVGGVIAPTDSSDTYAVTDDAYGRGGFRPVADTTERDAITSDRRKPGMLVRTNTDNKLWVLGAGLTNSDWSLLSVSSAGASLVASQNISGHTAVALDAVGGAIPADASTAQHSAVLGIATGAALAGGDVTILSHGAFEHLGWTFTPGLPVFLGLAGALTQTVPPTALFSKVLGMAVTPTRISVDFQPAIFL